MEEHHCQSRPWNGEPCLLGIDEAGRGPVLGPLVYGAVYCPLSKKNAILSSNFADSKVLTAEIRSQLFQKILVDPCTFGWIADVISAQSISCQMLSIERKSLNEISFQAAFGLIQTALDRGVNVTEVYVDTVGDELQYRDRLEKRFPGITFVVKKKADSLYPIVSAASIIAKVTRDSNLAGWEDRTVKDGGKVGSGYPGDPETKAWLSNNLDPVFGFSELVRFSWSTCNTLLEESENAAVVQWEGEEEVTAAGNNKRRRSGKVLVESSAPTRHPFFRLRQLQQVTSKF